MDTMFGCASLVITTVLALFMALALQGLLLRAMVALMQPATADRRAQNRDWVKARGSSPGALRGPAKAADGFPGYGQPLLQGPRC